MTPDDLANLRLVARVLDGVAYGAIAMLGVTLMAVGVRRRHDLEVRGIQDDDPIGLIGLFLTALVFVRLLIWCFA